MKRTLLPALGLAAALPALGLAAALLGTGTGGALSGHDTAASMTAASQASKVGKGAAFSRVLHLTNNSDKELHFVSAGLTPAEKIDPAPAATVAPDGGTDTIFLTSTEASGAETTMTYRVDGTETQVQGFFQVPTLDFNKAACTGYSSKDKADCNIAGGYHPNATWTIRQDEI
jgi:hypothetical protein